MLYRTDDRIGRLKTGSMTRIATAGAAFWVLMCAAGTAWPQAASPPSSPGVQAPAEQAAPDRPAPLQGEPAPAPPPPAAKENPGLLNEMGKLLDKSLSVFPT